MSVLGHNNNVCRRFQTKLNHTIYITLFNNIFAPFIVSISKSYRPSSQERPLPSLYVLSSD